MTTSLCNLPFSSSLLPSLPFANRSHLLPLVSRLSPPCLRIAVASSAASSFPIAVIDSKLLSVSPADAAPVTLGGGGGGGGGGGDAMRSCFPALAWANVLFSSGGHYNAQVVVGEEEPEEVLLRRFKREVFKAGIIQECKRRRWFESTQEKRKRKTREAARRNRKRRYQPKVIKKDRLEEPKKKKADEVVDSWEIPEGEIPYCSG